MALSQAQRQATYRAKHPEKLAAYKASAAFKEKDIAWRAANRGHINANGRMWWSKNREKMLALRKDAYDPIKNKIRSAAYYAKRRVAKLAQNKAWRDANPDKCKELARRWKERNSEYYRARSAEYGADRFNLMKKATPKWVNKFFMREIYHLAQLRTKYLGVPHHVDHIIPLQSPVVCGLHVESNLRVIPARDNIRKGNTLLDNVTVQGRSSYVVTKEGT